MRIERVVVNASPLITLFRSDQAGLLPQLFSEILVPEAVWREVVESDHEDVATAGLRTATWTKKIAVQVSPRIAVWNLGAGESEVLTVALDRPDYRAMVDDRAARRCARTLGIRVLGTGGMLILAKRRGLIASVADGLNRLRESGLWLSDDLVALLLKQAGESFRGH
jgi:predicted nucleic acid-binding protein